MDFIDLEEQEFASFPSFQQNFPISPDLLAFSLRSASASTESVSSKPSAKALFLRSASAEGEREAASSRDTARCPEFRISLGPGTAPVLLRFNPKGPHQEGRDSQVFQGSLVSDILTLKVAVKVYYGHLVTQQNACKEVEISKCTAGRPDFLKFYFSGPLAIDGTTTLVSVWEWIDNGPLDRAISKVDIFQVIRSIAASLNFLHSNHIAHHDLKPQNILIAKNYTDIRVILIDFGDSKQLNSANESTPIDEGIGLGTLAYTAPELLSKKSPYYSPFAADVYSFGVLLFYLLNCGTVLPFATLIPHRAVQLILTVQKGFFAGEYNIESPTHSPLFPLMKACLQVDPLKRPTLPQIVEIIKEKIPS